MIVISETTVILKQAFVSIITVLMSFSIVSCCISNLQSRKNLAKLISVQINQCNNKNQIHGGNKHLQVVNVTSEQMCYYTKTQNTSHKLYKKTQILTIHYLYSYALDDAGILYQIYKLMFGSTHAQMLESKQGSFYEPFECRIW